MQINIKETPLGAEEITGFAKQIKYNARINLDACVFEGSSFPRLCHEIQHCKGEVGLITALLFQQEVKWKSNSFSDWKFMYFMLYLIFVKMSME